MAKLNYVSVMSLDGYIGNGIPVIPVLPKDMALRLELLEERRLSGGWVYLRYRIQLGMDQEIQLAR